MATMATLVADLLKKIFTSEFSWVFITSRPGALLRLPG
jgi:hypothetical protein